MNYALIKIMGSNMWSYCEVTNHEVKERGEDQFYKIAWIYQLQWGAFVFTERSGEIS